MFDGWIDMIEYLFDLFILLYAELFELEDVI